LTGTRPLICGTAIMLPFSMPAIQVAIGCQTPYPNSKLVGIVLKSSGPSRREGFSARGAGAEASMPVTLESIVLREGYLEVQFGGAYNGPSYRSREYLERIFHACEQHQCSRVLLDHTRVIYQTDILAEHSVGEALAQMAPPGVRLAFVSPISTLPHPSHFETVAVNRGARVRVFWDRQQALAWLLKASVEP
jgi:hypothetical protein